MYYLFILSLYQFFNIYKNMQQKEQSQYLQYKNIPITPKAKYSSPKNITNNNLYTSVSQKIKRQNKNNAIQNKSKNKQTFVSNCDIFKNSSISKEGKSRCQVISFLASSTKRNKSKQWPNNQSTKEKSKQCVIMSPQNSIRMAQNRLNKAKSQLNLNYEHNRVQSGGIKQRRLIEEIMHQKNNQFQQFENNNQHNYSPHQLLKQIKFYQSKIQRLQKQIQLKNKKIIQLQSQKSNKQKLVKSQIQRQSFLLPGKKYDKQQNRQNVRRLLKMLQLTEQYNEFATFALEDNGINLLESMSKKHKTKIDLLNSNNDNRKRPSNSKKYDHCLCNKQLGAQVNLWVPQSIYEYGKQVFKFNQQQSLKEYTLTRSQYQLLLYQLNKMWRQRQKRIINTLKQQKNREIQKLNTKYNLYHKNLYENRSSARTKKNYAY